MVNEYLCAIFTTGIDFDLLERHNHNIEEIYDKLHKEIENIKQEDGIIIDIEDIIINKDKTNV